MDLPNCKICQSPFDLSENLPVILPTCGHTYCKQCLERMLRQSTLRTIICPEDGKVS